MEITRRRVQAAILVVLFLALLHPFTEVRADAVISNAFISTGSTPSGSNNFPSGTSILNFGYTVQTPDVYATVEVDIISPTGDLISDTFTGAGSTGQQSVFLAPNSGTAFPDGGYCVIMQMNGVLNDASGSLPIPFTIGNASMPDCAAAVQAYLGTSGSNSTATVTATPLTPSITPQPTITPLPSLTPVPTWTPVPTATLIPSLTPLPTATLSAVQSATPLPTNAAPTATASPVTLTPLSTATLVPTQSLAPTFTATPTATPSSFWYTPPPTATLTPGPAPSATTVLAPSPKASPVSPPTGSLKHFVLALGAPLHSRRFNTYQVLVHGMHGHPVVHVQVRLDGHGVGMVRPRIGFTNNFGAVQFTNLWPRYPGRLLVTASKPGWTSVAVAVVVQ